MEKTSVYNGEVIGYTVGRLFHEKLTVVDEQFETMDDAQGYCDIVGNYDTDAVYFPVKLTSLANKYLREPSFD